jgi:hypothetical protein
MSEALGSEERVGSEISHMRVNNEGDTVRGSKQIGKSRISQDQPRPCRCLSARVVCESTTEAALPRER